MKTHLPVLALLALFILNPEFSTAFAQGSLIPPGPPAPTMKTLAQIEPRTPIATNTTPGDAYDIFIINQPGSYYLTGNLNGITNDNAIEILANNVTLDLNGFAIQAVSTNVNFPLNIAVFIPDSQTNIIVRNGCISGWAQGVYSASTATANLVLERLNIANFYYSSSVDTVGVNVFGSVVARDCTFERYYYGLACNGDNIVTGSQITGCVADDNVIGISCGGGGLISGCVADNNSSDGIQLVNYISSTMAGSTVSGCNLNNNASGIYIYSANNRIEDNHITATSGEHGIDVEGTGNTNNIIIKNSVIGTGGYNYIIPAGQVTGPIISTTGTISSANPWANFSF